MSIVRFDLLIIKSTKILKLIKGCILIIPGNQTIETNKNNNTVIVPSVPNEGARWAFHRFLDKFDRYTLIMVTAFVVGLFLIFLLVAVVLCICKKYNITFVKYSH